MRRIPTILALLFLILLIGGVIGGMEYFSQSKLSRQPDNPPKNVQFTITDQTSGDRQEYEGILTIASSAEIRNP